MAPGPVELAVRDALETAQRYITAGEFECLAFVEIDAVEAVKHLMREGSPRLRQAITQAALDETALSKAA